MPNRIKLESVNFLFTLSILTSNKDNATPNDTLNIIFYGKIN
jgi:hypothetical protein